MIDLARISAGTIFLTLLILSYLVEVEWKFTAVGWGVNLGWYVIMRASLSESKEYLRHPAYALAAAISFAYLPLLAVAGVVLGDEKIAEIVNSNGGFLMPFGLVTVMFFFTVYGLQLVNWLSQKAERRQIALFAGSVRGNRFSSYSFGLLECGLFTGDFNASQSSRVSGSAGRFWPF